LGGGGGGFEFASLNIFKVEKRDEECWVVEAIGVLDDVRPGRLESTPEPGTAFPMYFRAEIEYP